MRYNSRYLHSLSHVILSKKHMMQVLEGISRGTAGIWGEKKRVGEQEDERCFDQCRPRPHGDSISGPKCVQIKPWEPAEDRHPISYNNLWLVSERRDLWKCGHPEGIWGPNHSDFPIWCVGRKRSPSEWCAARSLGLREPSDWEAIAPNELYSHCKWKRKAIYF